MEDGFHPVRRIMTSERRSDSRMLPSAVTSSSSGYLSRISFWIRKRSLSAWSNAIRQWRSETRHLPADLRADGAGRAGHHHRTAFDRGLHLRLVQAYLLASKQILHRGIAHLRVEDPAAQQLVDAGNRLTGYPRGAAVGQRLAHLRTRCRRHRDHDLADSGLTAVELGAPPRRPRDPNPTPQCP